MTWIRAGTLAEPRQRARIHSAQLYPVRGRRHVPAGRYRIHYMHDKYCYEAIEMALHDRDILRTLACGIAGLSHAADSLSAIKYAKVKPIRDERGLIVDFETTGEFPCYGNNDDRADDLAKMLVSSM